MMIECNKCNGEGFIYSNIRASGKVCKNCNGNGFINEANLVMSKKYKNKSNIEERIINFYEKYKDEIIECSSKHIIDCLKKKNELELLDAYIKMSKAKQMKIANYWNNRK